MRLEEDRRLLHTSNPVLGLYLLCLNCEEYTGTRAVRQITPDGSCSTCGSKSVLRIQPPVWPWQRKEEH